MHRRVRDEADDVLDVNHADRIIEISSVNGQARMACVRERLDEIRQRRLDIDGDDVSARRHHVRDALFIKRDDTLDHVAPRTWQSHRGGALAVIERVGELALGIGARE